MEKLRMPANLIFIGLIGAKLGVFNAILAFVVTGAIPGTLASIPPGAMLLVTVTGVWLIALRFTLPFLVRRHILQTSPKVVPPAVVPVDTVVCTSRQPRFRLFSPIININR